MFRGTSFLLLVVAFVLGAEGCAQMRASPKPCQTCRRNLAETQTTTGRCSAKSTCIACSTTDVDYAYQGTCLIASLTCKGTITLPRVRFHKKDGTFQDVTYDQKLQFLTCSTSGVWRYESEDGETIVNNIVKAVCFGNSPNMQQSPINIDLEKTVHTDQFNAGLFKPVYQANIIDRIHMAKDEHGFTVFMKDTSRSFFTASHLDATYRFFQFHAHWADDFDITEGSEHLINGRPYTAEFHFVHFNPKYGTFMQALGKEDGVAVIAILCQLSGTNNPALDPLVDAIAEFVESGSTEEDIRDEAIMAQNPLDIFPENKNYYAYTGSLTTPEYQTCVAWSVLTTPISISKDQLTIFHGLLDRGNFRAEQQLLDGTTIYTSLTNGAAFNHDPPSQRLLNEVEKDSHVEEEEKLHPNDEQSTMNRQQLSWLARRFHDALEMFM